MISPAAVSEFLARPLRDSARAKRFTAAAIDAKLSALAPQLCDVGGLYLHQKASLLLGIRYGSYLFLHDQGLGKSLLSLSLFRYFRKAGTAPRALVLVPNASNVYAWLDEAGKHAPELTAAGLDEGGAANAKILADPAIDLVISTYAGILRHATNPRAGKWQIAPPRADKVAAGFGMLVLDEITACGNSRSLTWKVCRRFANKVPLRFGLTGTPFGKDPTPLWAQFYLIDKGETLGETLGMFRAAYFREKEDYWAGVTYVFDKRKAPLLHRALRNRSIRYRKEECLDLPPKVFSRREVAFGPEIAAYHAKIIEELRAAEGNASLVKNVFHRLRSVCAGWLSYADEETGEKRYADFGVNPKRDALLALLEEIGPREKVVIFNHYRHTGDLLTLALAAEDIPHVRLWAGTPARERAVIQGQFGTDPACRVFLASSAGAYGLNLQAARYVVFYETPSDPKMRKQCADRVHRIGQTRPVFIYDVCVRGSIETKILAALAAGEDLFAAIVGGRSPLSLV